MPTTVNPGYRLRKEQFAKEVPVTNPDTGAITGYKWIWAEDSVFFCGPVYCGLNFTPLLPNTTIKVDFEINDPSFYFLSKTTTDLKVSFEQAILKIPRYQVSEIDNTILLDPALMFCFVIFSLKPAFTKPYFRKLTQTP